MSELHTLVTLLAVFVAIAIAVGQARNQFRLTQQAAKEQNRLRVKAEVYKAISDRVEQSVVLNKRIYFSLLDINIAIEVVKALDEEESTYKPHEVWRLPDLANAHNDNISRLIVMLESYEIINPRLEIFQGYLAAKLEFVSGMFSQLRDKIFVVFGENQQQFDMHSAADRLENDKYARNIVDVLDMCSKNVLELGGFLDDLQIDAQNVLLGDLFDRRLAQRGQFEPNHIVLSIDEPWYSQARKLLEEDPMAAAGEQVTEPFSRSSSEAPASTDRPPEYLSSAPAASPGRGDTSRAARAR